MMERLWAPWRMAYIKDAAAAGDSDTECVLCRIAKEADKEEENLVVARGKHVFVVLNRFPYSNGHLMISPYKHVRDFSGLAPRAVTELVEYTQESINTLRRMSNPDGFNLGANLGRVAGAGIDFHLHMHVVPRWSGDTNFMPVLADVKVIAQALEETWRELRSHWQGG